MHRTKPTNAKWRVVQGDKGNTRRERRYKLAVVLQRVRLRMSAVRWAAQAPYRHHLSIKAGLAHKVIAL
jgi:hypothetical protein